MKRFLYALLAPAKMCVRLHGTRNPIDWRLLVTEHIAEFAKFANKPTVNSGPLLVGEQAGGGSVTVAVGVAVAVSVTVAVFFCLF